MKAKDQAAPQIVAIQFLQKKKHKNIGFFSVLELTLDFIIAKNIEKNLSGHQYRIS